MASAHAAPRPPASLPLRQNGGTWNSGHVQGIAVDLKGGYVYYSFTNLLAKYDFEGRLVGTLAGWKGHLGDLDFNPADGKLYGSLEYKRDNAFYIAVVDVARLDRPGMRADTTDLLQTVFLREVADDFSADLNGNGKFESDAAFPEDPGASPDHRYGCSGIDGVAFGPRFGQSSGKHYLTVAYGIYGNTVRTDNDHQVLLQYDVSDWARYARPLVETAPHRNGPASALGKYFVRTGNTRFGVQTLSYDESMNRWFLGVYPGNKPDFPNYLLFAVDARAAPLRADLVGVPGRGDRRWAQGMLLPLAADGLRDPATGIRGWNVEANLGFQPVGRGLFYLAAKSGSKGRQSGDVTLMRWTGDPQAPLTRASAADLLETKSGPAPVAANSQAAPGVGRGRNSP